MLNLKSQITNHKQIQIPNEQNHKQEDGFCLLEFCSCVLFVICILCIVIYSNAYALNLDKLKSSFLSGDYKSAIKEGEKILATKGSSSDLDELYYILGLCYMRDGNYLRASDIFEIIINECKKSRLKEDAKLSLADTYFLRQDFDKAKNYYQKILIDNDQSKLKAEIYYRLSQLALKKGEPKQAEEYLNKLKQEFPANKVLTINKELSLLSEINQAGIYYTVQVGSFSNATNANNLLKRLLQRGYAAYIEEVVSQSKSSYRVRVGKTCIRQEIVDLESKLAKEGYPTKIYP